MRHYHRKSWLNFRKEVIEIDGGVCVRCRRGPLQGAVLQVHHKRYLLGKLPWEYPYELCETLCKGCHAGEHGIIRPFAGWECIGHEDLGEPLGKCELCGKDIRHVFLVQHKKWPSLEVGEICCDHLTDTGEASEYMDSKRRYDSRQQRFIRSKRWKSNVAGVVRIDQRGVDVVVEQVGQAFRLRVNNMPGKRRFSSVIDAKMLVFEIFENGQIDAFLQKHRSYK